MRNDFVREFKVINIGNALLESDPLVELIQEDNFVGWVYNIDYDKALVMTNDLWKIKALGIPHNCFLIAASFDPSKFSAIAEEEQEVILLRVIGSARLPQDEQLVKAKIDRFQSRTGKYESANLSTNYDDITAITPVNEIVKRYLQPQTKNE